MAETVTETETVAVGVRAGVWSAGGLACLFRGRLARLSDFETETETETVTVDRGRVIHDTTVRFFGLFRTDGPDYRTVCIYE